jgi:NADPH2:quinone reductase
MAKKWVAVDFGSPDVLREIEVEIPVPRPGEVTITVRAAGMNPADYKEFASGADRSVLPLSIGFEVAGAISAIGPGTDIASGGGKIGDEVLAFQIAGGYTSAITVQARDVLAKPGNVSFAEAANLLQAGTTAADLLDVARVSKGDTIVLHGASGAVGVSVLQQARLIGTHVIGTASENNFGMITRFGGIPVQYGPGLEDLIRQVAPGASSQHWTLRSPTKPSTCRWHSSRTERASSASWHLVAHNRRAIRRSVGLSRLERRSETARARLLGLAAEGKLVVPVAQTFPLAQAKSALDLLMSRHPGGKLALIPEQEDA